MPQSPRAYWMLAASLPALAPGADLPIGRERLRSRLALLNARDRALIEAGAALLDALDIGRGDEAAALAEAQRWRARLEREAGPAVATCAESLLADRTLVAALRRRAAGAPPAGWGFGPHRAALAWRWAQPRFGLDAALPWLADAERRLAARDALGLQALLDARAWQAAARLRAAEPFAFGAVFGWWLQWRLLARRQAMAEAERVAARWRELLAQAPSP